MVVPDIFPWTFTRVRAGPVVEQLDVGDQGIGDEHSVERPTGLDGPELALDQADLGFGLDDLLDQVGHVPGDFLVRPSRRRSRWAFGSQARGIARERDEPGLRRRGPAAGRARRRIDRDHPGDRLEGDRRRQRGVRSVRSHDGSRWRLSSRRGNDGYRRRGSDGRGLSGSTPVFAAESEFGPVKGT